MTSEIHLTIKGTGHQQILNTTFYKDPDKVFVNGTIRSDCQKFCDLTSDTNIIILQFNYDVLTCKNMFYGTNNMTEIDLSNFDARNINSMNNMFRECTNLVNINFGNMDTSNSKDMESLFMDCNNIKSIDLSNFDTSSMENSKQMFSGCKSLISLDLTNFKTTKLKNMFDMFCNCHELLFVNLSSFDTSNTENMRGIFFACRKIKYIDLPNFSASSMSNFWYTFSYCYKLVYLNLRNFKITNFDNVHLHDDTFRGHPSNTKYCIEDSETKNFLLGDINVNCSDFCFQENVILDLNTNECICNEYYKFEYNNKCYQTCLRPLKQIKTNKYICSNDVPDNYYLDENDNIYKKCFSKYKKCSKSGNNTYHNCNECIEGYTLLNNSMAIKNNCYLNCSIYYVFRFFNSHACFSDCFSPYNKLIEPKSKCIDNCKNDDEYIYVYNNKCFKKCPENTKTYEEEKKCLDSCSEEQFEYNNICYNDCPENTYRLLKNRNICVLQMPENYYLDKKDNIYKKCYERCKTCSEKGNETINNCYECINGFTFLNDSFVELNNCYDICQYY